MRALGEQDDAKQKARETPSTNSRTRRSSHQDWPDPFLGLAHAYSYEQPDLNHLRGIDQRGGSGAATRPGRRGRGCSGERYRMPRRSKNLAQAHAAEKGCDQETRLLVEVPRRLHPVNEALPRRRQHHKPLG